MISVLYIEGFLTSAYELVSGGAGSFLHNSPNVRYTLASFHLLAQWIFLSVHGK